MSKSRLSVREWIVWIGAVAIALAVTKFLGVAEKWENAILDTVTIFTGVFIVTRPMWGRENFWLDFVAIFLFHCVILGGIVQSLPAESAGLHGILMIPVVMAESCFIVFILWLRTIRSNSHPS